MIARIWAYLCRLCLLLALALASMGLVGVYQRYPIGVLLLAAALAWRNSRRIIGSAWSHGSARLGNFADLLRGGMLCDSGITLGTTELIERPSLRQAMWGLLSPLTRSDQACRAFFSAVFGSRWQAGQFIRIRNFVHIATFAKTGGGKGVALIVPNLLSYFLSVVVIDIKGELWKLTAEHRRRRFRHKVIRLDPLGIADKARPSETINPCDFIDETSDDFLDQCRELADDFIVKTGKEQEQHWIDSARLVLTAFIAFVCGCEADRSKRNLNTVRMFVSSRVAFANAIQIMQEQPDACQGVIAKLGNMLTWYVDRELGSVLSTVQRFTEFLDSPAIQRSVESSSFDPRILRTGKVSLYLCLPHDKVATLAPLQRMWISTIMRTIAKDGTGEKHPVLFVLDEAAHLGKIESIERAVTLSRGMGIRLWFAFQSHGQVKEVFGDKADIMLDNIGTQQYFAVSAFESAKAISDRIGETTITVRSVNKTVSNSRPTGGGPNGNQPGSFSSSTSTTTSDTARRLLRPEEIMTLEDDVSLVFHNNLPVVPTRLIKYFEHPSFRRGGTGKARGLGLRGGVMAASLLVMSYLFLGMASSLPDPATLRRLVAMPARQRVTSTPLPTYGGQQRFQPLPSGIGRQLPPRNPFLP